MPTSVSTAIADGNGLNKIDLVTPAEPDQLEARLHAMNRTARIHRTRDAELDLDRLLNVRALWTWTRSSNSTPISSRRSGRRGARHEAIRLPG